MTHAGNDKQLGAADEFRRAPARGHVDERVTVTVNDQCGDPDGADGLGAVTRREDGHRLPHDPDVAALIATVTGNVRP